ncbi:MAG: hypothetical protein II867_02575 [Clostridia bacterium]|nr:hypothetical protein [Clostridia bacterium]
MAANIRFNSEPTSIVRQLSKAGYEAYIVGGAVRDYLLGKTDKFIAPGEQGIIGLTFSNAIHLAGWTGKEIAIPFDEELYLKELEKRKEEEVKAAK